MTDLLNHTRDPRHSLWQSLQDQLKFSNVDVGWKETVEQFIKFSILEHKDIPYRPNWGHFTLGSRVGIVGDWGTGTPIAEQGLKLLVDKGIDTLIHLGDIYYSGTPWEVDNRFLAPCRRFLPPSVSVYSLPGNHDMYSGGQGYYGLVDVLGQRSSHFTLENKDWLFVGLDTARYDFNPLQVGTEWTTVTPQEAEVARDMIQSKGDKKCVVLSHHPLFAGLEPINGRYVNPNLYQQFGGVIHGIDAWFWGHEHRLGIYNQSCLPQLRKGRCVGNSAIPVTIADDNKPLDPRYTVACRMGNNGVIANHAVALIELDGPKGTASYLEVETGKELWREIL